MPLPGQGLHVACALTSNVFRRDPLSSDFKRTAGFPRAGSQGYPTPAASAEPDGTTVIAFGPRQPDGVADGNWIQTDPAKGWFLLLRLHSPLPTFFDKTWRAGDLDPVE
jgi:hypothetical protein